jgi:CRISPR-associated protein Cst2
MKLYSLSICGRITLNLHSLNNEGGEGNQTLTRQVNIVARDENGQPKLHAVNAISGDMIKHIQAEHLHRICIADGLDLCGGCRTFSANRVNDDQGFFQQLGKERDNVEVIKRLLPACTMDDLLGILITQGNRSNPRKSVAEYGWIVALPELSRTESYFHVKYGPLRRTTQASGEQAEGSNVGQAIFHRPANSGVYAVVANYEFWRIGYNDVACVYVVDDDDKKTETHTASGRKTRARALLKSILYAFLQPNGAQRNTQNPHILDFQGVISSTSSPVPAPTVSPINEAYGDQIKGIKSALNPVVNDAIEVEEFKSLKEFAEIMTRLISQAQPYRVSVKP